MRGITNEDTTTTSTGVCDQQTRGFLWVSYRRKFRSQTSDNMDRWKAERGRVREKRRVEERRWQKRKSQKKEDADARKGRKVPKCFPNDLRLRFSKSRLAKAAGAEPSGQMSDEKVHAVVARSTFRSQNVQSTPASDHFGSWDVEKVHAVVARSTCRSRHVQSTPCSDHFWKLRCRKSAHRCGAKHICKWKNISRSEHFWKLRSRKSARGCGAKHIFKSKCTNHTMYGPLLDVQISFRVAGARDHAPCQKWAKREVFVASPKTMAGVGHAKMICKDAFSVAGAVQETSHRSC